MRNCVKMNTELKNLLKRINHIESKGKYIQFSLHFLPQFPRNNYELTDTDKTIQNVIFYTSRAFHFARSYLNRLNITLNNFNHPISLKTKYAIENEISYEFDAFVIMSKSILEGNTHKKISFPNPKLLAYFNTFKKHKFNNFVKTFLTPVRDEIVHLNNMGTSWGNFIEFKNLEKTKFKITSYHKVKSKPYEDLHDLFLELLEELLKTLDELFSIFHTHYILTFGNPKENLILNIGEEKIGLNNFQILC